MPKGYVKEVELSPQDAIIIRAVIIGGADWWANYHGLVSRQSIHKGNNKNNDLSSLWINKATYGYQVLNCHFMSLLSSRSVSFS